MADSHDSRDIKFYDPDQRALIPIDNTLGRGVHIPRRSNARSVKPLCGDNKSDFTAVIDACVTLSNHRKDMINRDIADLYSAAQMGCTFGRSLAGRALGGAYGVALRAAFWRVYVYKKKVRQKSPLSIHGSVVAWPVFAA